MKGPLKVVVTGSRDWSDYVGIKTILADLKASHSSIAIAHGGASGADALAVVAARALKIKSITAYLADWEKHGRAAGPVRNSEMLSLYHPGLVLAFSTFAKDNLPVSLGTLDTWKGARLRGITRRLYSHSPSGVFGLVIEETGRADYLHGPGYWRHR